MRMDGADLLPADYWGLVAGLRSRPRWGSLRRSPSGVWGGAAAASEFCAFYLLFHAI